MISSLKTKSPHYVGSAAQYEESGAAWASLQPVVFY